MVDIPEAGPAGVGPGSRPAFHERVTAAPARRAMMSCVQRTAYVDESEPAHQPEPGVYVLAAAIVDDPAPGRDTMSGLLLPGQNKVHWNREPERHLLLTQKVSTVEASHLLVIRTDATAGSERRRRLCITRLFHELEARAVAQVVMEARQAKQNTSDLRMLDHLRARKVISSSLRLDHVPGPKEPLLWMPDIVAGAYGAHQAGAGAPFGAVADQVEVIDC